MTTIKQRIAQQWPRFIVGLYAAWGILNNLATLWMVIFLETVPKTKLYRALHSSSEVEPEDTVHMFKTTLIIFGTVFAFFNSVALYAAVRKSITAAKTSFIFWIVQMSWAAIALVFLFITLQGMSDSDREQVPLPHPSTTDYVMVGVEFLLTGFHGWALFVYLRDLKDRQRNIWGFLVRTGGVFEYEPVNKIPGPVHL
ncbi:MAG: hypothetical protein J3R72DRAFT_430276 [Linnemannia gamsii]|nr:MAG: hypothetical protein J3R72DRAFT_430276 [Linnemannia gamsii]